MKEELREIRPIGEWILNSKYLEKGVQGKDGIYFHYADVCSMLKDFKKETSNYEN